MRFVFGRESTAFAFFVIEYSFVQVTCNPGA